MIGDLGSRELVDGPEICQQAGDLTQIAEREWFTLIAGKDQRTSEAIKRYATP